MTLRNVQVSKADASGRLDFPANCSKAEFKVEIVITSRRLSVYISHCRKYAAPILRCPMILSSNAYRSARVPSPWDSASGMMFGCLS